MNYTDMQGTKICETRKCENEVFRESVFACDTCIDVADVRVTRISRLMRRLPDELENGSSGAVLHSANPDTVIKFLSLMAPSASRPWLCHQDEHSMKDMTPDTLMHVFSSLLGGSDWYVAEHLHAAAGRPWWPVFFNAVGATAQRLERLTGGGIEMVSTDVRCIQDDCDGYLERADLPVAMLEGEGPGANRWACRVCFTGYSREEFAEAEEAKAEKVRERIAERREELAESTDDWLTVRDAAIISGRTKTGINRVVARGEIAHAHFKVERWGRETWMVYVFMPDVLEWSAKRKAPVHYRVPA